MNTTLLELESKLTSNDKILLERFAKLLLEKEKYKKVREDIEKRRKEVKEGKYLTHEEFWRDI